MNDRSSAWGIEHSAFLDERAARTRDDVIIAVEEPTVVPKEIIASIPGSMQTGVWGTPQDVLGYLMHVNGVPEHALIEIDEDTASRDRRVRFTWWEITARVAREPRR